MEKPIGPKNIRECNVKDFLAEAACAVAALVVGSLWGYCVFRLVRSVMEVR